MIGADGAEKLGRRESVGVSVPTASSSATRAAQVCHPGHRSLARDLKLADSTFLVERAAEAVEPHFVAPGVTARQFVREHGNDRIDQGQRRAWLAAWLTDHRFRNTWRGRRYAKGS